MKFFSIVAIIMGLFLITSIAFIFIKEKENRKSNIVDFIIYNVVGIILITVGIISLFIKTKMMGLISTIILIVVLTIFVIYISLKEKKGKKIIKYQTKGHGKNKSLVEKKEKFEDDSDKKY